MEKEEMERLGFTEQVSWENEESEKKFLYDKINLLKEKAKKNIENNLKEKIDKNKENK